MVNIVTVEKQTKKIMQGTTEAVGVKNKFLQDLNGPTSYHFSNGPSLNRILGYLPFTRENRKFHLENQMVRAIPFWEASENMGCNTR